MFIALLFNKCNLQKFASNQQLRYYLRNMEYDLLKPPERVRSMTILNHDDFKKTIEVPRLWVDVDKTNIIMPLVKKVLLKRNKMKPVRAIQSRMITEADGKELREILLHPTFIKSWNDLPVDLLQKYGVNNDHFGFTKVQLTYDNWRADEILKAVLPDKEGGFTSYSSIGHIIHLNLREHLLPFQRLIGQVLLDKVPGCRTVINKVSNIENEYRIIKMQLICGDDDYEVTTRENGITYQFDFSKVYWNPRLVTEHERICDMLQPNDVLYDVFAGVGPFTVPAARKKCIVLANDLNPDSYKWLKVNIKNNKCLNQVKVFNMDGRDFICKIMKKDLYSRWLIKEKPQPDNYNIHVTMNLPALAAEFLTAFRGLFLVDAKNDNQKSLISSMLTFRPMPLVHVYVFGKGSNKEQSALDEVLKYLGPSLDRVLHDANFVRSVSTNKDMYRITFHLTKDILLENYTQKNERKRRHSAPLIENNYDKHMKI